MMSTHLIQPETIYPTCRRLAQAQSILLRLYLTLAIGYSPNIMKIKSPNMQILNHTVSFNFGLNMKVNPNLIRLNGLCRSTQTPPSLLHVMGFFGFAYADQMQIQNCLGLPVGSDFVTPMSNTLTYICQFSK